MRLLTPIRSLCRVAGVAALCVTGTAAFAHGGVVGDDDLCVINIGYLKAHFKIYVPQETAHDDYCEDIPVRGESIFIMEYQHDTLNESLIDFRIIRNVTGKGTFARLDDVQAIDDLDAVTVRYEPQKVVPAVYMLRHDFERDGEYIGVVSATNADRGTSYTAVFPFEVGYTGIGIWPWIIGALVVLQLQFWFMNRRRGNSASVVAVAAGMLLASGGVAADDAGNVWVSDSGHFHVRVERHGEPVTINRMHDWLLDVRHADGSLVVDADFEVGGGMPEHNHGLPSAPRVEERLGDGRFRLAGMRFHMRGYWEIRITISDERHRDTVTIPLTIS